MAKSCQTFQKRQREFKLREKAQRKRERRQERSEKKKAQKDQPEMEVIFTCYIEIDSNIRLDLLREEDTEEIY